MTKWDYIITEPYLQNMTEEEYLKKMGQDGWEMTSCIGVPRSAGIKFYFKRPIPDTKIEP